MSASVTTYILEFNDIDEKTVNLLHDKYKLYHDSYTIRNDLKKYATKENSCVVSVLTNYKDLLTQSFTWSKEKYPSLNWKLLTPED